MSSEGEVVHVDNIDEYVIQVVQRGSGYTWTLRSPALTMMSPTPMLESLQLYVDIPAAVRAAKEAYQALPLVFV